MIAMPFGPLLAWKRGDLLGAAQRLMAAVASLRWSRSPRPWRWTRVAGRARAVRDRARRSSSMAGALSDLVERTRIVPRPAGYRVSLRRAARLAALGLRHRVRAFRHRRVA